MNLSKPKYTLFKLAVPAVILMLTICTISCRQPQSPSVAIQNPKEPYILKQHILFDSTFTIESEFPIPTNAAMDNGSSTVVDTILFSNYADKDVNLSVISYRYKPGIALDTSYSKIANSYLNIVDGSSVQRSLIKQRQAVTINGKKFIKFSGERDMDQNSGTNDYTYDNFDLLIQENQPYIYALYFGYNSTIDNVEAIKEKMYKSIKITNRKK